MNKEHAKCEFLEVRVGAEDKFLCRKYVKILGIDDNNPVAIQGCDLRGRVTDKYCNKLPPDEAAPKPTINLSGRRISLPSIGPDITFYPNTRVHKIDPATFIPEIKNVIQ